MTTVFFTHIPKTAGTAVRRNLLYPNIPPAARGHGRGFRDLLRRDWSRCRWLEGHCPYGVHRYMRGLAGHPVYFTLLRDPVEQAISYYYFILACSTRPQDPYVHPGYRDAKERGIVEFYRCPRYQNVQTRFIAGCVWHRVRNHAAAKPFDRRMLSAAKRNLMRRYACFGLVERFDESMRMIAGCLGWPYVPQDRRVKATPDRPLLADLPEETRAALRALFAIDLDFYDYAQRQFEEQTEYRRQFCSSCTAACTA